MAQSFEHGVMPRAIGDLIDVSMSAFRANWMRIASQMWNVSTQRPRITPHLRRLAFWPLSWTRKVPFSSYVTLENAATRDGRWGDEVRSAGAGNSVRL